MHTEDRYALIGYGMIAAGIILQIITAALS